MTTQNNKLGEVAMELIADYPLYASTSNITYEEAIAVAKVFFGDDLQEAQKEIDNIDDRLAKMTKEEVYAEMLAYDKKIKS